jgi:hypothetical protein
MLLDDFFREEPGWTGELCPVLSLASCYVRNWIKRQPAVKEESITDWLLDWTQFHCPQLHYTPFTRHEEAKGTGADWEWWILAGSTALKLRIQAKRFKETGDNHPGIAHSNADGMQIDKLISDAQQVNALPLYAFYGVGGGACNVAQCTKNLDLFSIFIADAGRIRDTFVNVARQVVPKGMLLPHCIALHCLFCCGKLFTEWGDAVAAVSRFVTLHNAPRPVQEAEFNQSQGYYSDVPVSIRLFTEMRQPDARERWLREYASAFHDVEALVVLDLNAEP